MERYSCRAIDELGRLVLHSELRKKLCLETGGKISLLLVDTVIILRRIENEPEPGCDVSQINELGVIDLPIELRQKLGWQTADKVAMYHTDNLIILKLAK
jgi:bifunctional DNA-binding transcriptional regulator/antitoxin component of YhaV-PrlF toxin-antitoxin module